jgi:hypothetical protein
MLEKQTVQSLGTMIPNSPFPTSYGVSPALCAAEMAVARFIPL